MNYEALTDTKEKQHWELFGVVFDVPEYDLPKFKDPEDEARHRRALKELLPDPTKFNGGRL